LPSLALPESACGAKGLQACRCPFRPQACGCQLKAATPPRCRRPRRDHRRPAVTVIAEKAPVLMLRNIAGLDWSRMRETCYLKRSLPGVSVASNHWNEAATAVIVVRPIVAFRSAKGHFLGSEGPFAERKATIVSSCACLEHASNRTGASSRVPNERSRPVVTARTWAFPLSCGEPWVTVTREGK
jgi:hypothetical protein